MSPFMRVPSVKPLLTCLFSDSHMTCKKCKHEFCWVCMGNRQNLLHLPFVDNIQVRGRSMEQLGTRVTDTMRELVWRHGMLSRRAEPH